MKQRVLAFDFGASSGRAIIGEFFTGFSSKRPSLSIRPKSTPQVSMPILSKPPARLALTIPCLISWNSRRISQSPDWSW